MARGKTWRALLVPILSLPTLVLVLFLFLLALGGPL
jgi:hypothetical protein